MESSSSFPWLRMALVFIGFTGSIWAGEFITALVWLAMGLTLMELHSIRTERDSYRHMIEKKKKEDRLW